MHIVIMTRFNVFRRDNSMWLIKCVGVLNEKMKEGNVISFSFEVITAGKGIPNYLMV